MEIGGPADLAGSRHHYVYPQGIDQFQILVGVLSKNGKACVSISMGRIGDGLAGLGIARRHHARITHPLLGLVHRQDSSQQAPQKLCQGDAQTSRLDFGGLVFLFRQADLGSNHNDNNASYFVII